MCIYKCTVQLASWGWTSTICFFMDNPSISHSLFSVFFDEPSKTQIGYVSVRRMVLMAQERSRTIEHLFLWKVSHLFLPPSGRSWMSKCVYFSSFPFCSSNNKKKKYMTIQSQQLFAPLPLRHPLHLSNVTLIRFFFSFMARQVPGSALSDFFFFFFCEERRKEDR